MEQLKQQLEDFGICLSKTELTPEQQNELGCDGGKYIYSSVKNIKHHYQYFQL